MAVGQISESLAAGAAWQAGEGPAAGLGRRGLGEAELGPDPAGQFLDRVVGLGRVAGGHLDGVQLGGEHLKLNVYA